MAVAVLRYSLSAVRGVRRQRARRGRRRGDREGAGEQHTLEISGAHCPPERALIARPVAVAVVRLKK